MFSRISRRAAALLGGTAMALSLLAGTAAPDRPLIVHPEAIGAPAAIVAPAAVTAADQRAAAVAAGWTCSGIRRSVAKDHGSAASGWSCWRRHGKGYEAYLIGGLSDTKKDNRHATFR